MRIELSEHLTTKKLLRAVAPSVIMMLFTSIYGIVDGIFVSNFVGEKAFAAVNLIMPFMMAFGSIGFMLGTGGSALVGKTLGEGNPERAKQLFTMMVIFTAIIGVTISVVGIITLPYLAAGIGAQGETLSDCILYGDILFVGQTAFMLQNVFHSFFIVAEKPKLGLYVSLAAGVTNMILDALFVAGFGWGLTGA
ncbi:MAG: MATE family efflux transporter, partial [Clostridia bacterium]|nr:MATE family efflux transporter [Clostridia bacterium]